MKKVAFVCVHNSCRSQIAESFAKKYSDEGDKFYSAGTEKRSVNSDAIRLMNDVYKIDMSKNSSKLIDEIPSVDLVITMGCNVVCPVLAYEYETCDWGIEDPTGKSDEEFLKVMEEIRGKVLNLIEELKQKEE